MAIAQIRTSASDIARNIARTFLNNLPGVMFLWLVCCVIAGALFMVFEDDRGIWESIYWANTTGLSIGYGDISPVTGPGRTLSGVWGWLSIGMLIPMIIGLFIQIIIRNMHQFSDIEQRFLLSVCRFIAKAIWIVLKNLFSLGRKVDLIAQALATVPGVDKAKLAEAQDITIDDGSELQELLNDVQKLDSEEQKETVDEGY